MCAVDELAKCKKKSDVRSCSLNFSLHVYCTGHYNAICENRNRLRKISPIRTINDGE